MQRELPEKVGAGNPRLFAIATTPTYQYQMRKVDGQRKIVPQSIVFESDDDAATQYGPDTPHIVSSHTLY